MPRLRLAALSAALCFGLTDLAWSIDTFRLGVPDLVAGASGTEIRLLCDHDADALAVSFALTWDQAVLDVVAVVRDGSATESADYFSGRIDRANGAVGWGCVFDLSGDFSTKRLPAGVGQELARLVVDVAPSPPASTTLRFENVVDPTRPEVVTRNVITDTTGQSIEPLTQDATPLLHFPPRVDALLNASGFGGTRFTVLGAHLNEPGLTVRVGGVVAQTEAPAPDGSSVVVIAPACDSIGSEVVEVCTNHGCAVSPDSFVCERSGPDFIRGDCDGDGANLGVADAISMLDYAFRAGARPGCIAACDANSDGFFGGDPSDAVFVLLYAFGGGAAPAFPFPACGPSAPEDLALGCGTPPAGCP